MHITGLPTLPTPNIATKTEAPKRDEANQDLFSPSPLPNGETIAWGSFAHNRHKPGSGYSYFEGSPKDLLKLVHENWEQRKPGVGRQNLLEVVVVPVPPQRFWTTTVAVDDSTQLKAQLYKRREFEDPYVRVQAEGPAQPAQFAQVVLYSKATLESSRETLPPSDWEVVSVVASPVENEPMDPVTMMRNMKGKAGGSQVDYPQEQILDSIDFWSRHVKVTG